MVYTCSKGSAKTAPTTLFSFNTKTEEAKEIGPAAVGTQQYTTSIDVDPTGRYLYYVPGAHGHSENDGSAVVQYDVKTKTRKVIAFLSPYFQDKIGAIPTGTFSTAIDPAGDKLYITWNVKRGTAAWDCCALTVIHIPESERRP
jgi:DNA-binding beta-propeller fold protein YncE